MLPVIFVGLLVACATAPDSIPENLSAEEIFQRAQEAVVDRNDYATALLYYQTFLQRYPDDLQRVVEAEYEIAFVHYKMKDPSTAERLFRELLERYEAEGSQILPRWPRVLAEKMLAKLEGGENKSGATAEE